MDKIMEIIHNIWSIGLVQFIVYLTLKILHREFVKLFSRISLKNYRHYHRSALCF